MYKIIRKGTNLRVIQDQLAHSSVAVTERYLSVKAGAKELALEALVS